MRAHVAEETAKLHTSAAQLQDHLAGRSDVLDSGLSSADFRMAPYLAYKHVAGLPLDDYPSGAAWYWRPDALPHWQDPFAGLDAPDLPVVSGR